MADDKAAIKGYKASLKELYKETFSTFKGDLFSGSYKVKLKGLIDDYQTVINNIDKNMDALNIAMSQYENKAYELNGFIGDIQKAINTTTHKIQNLFN